MKPILYYSWKQPILYLDQPAIVVCINHPSPKVDNSTHFITTSIKRIWDDGSFETQDHIYKPEVVIQDTDDCNSERITTEVVISCPVCEQLYEPIPEILVGRYT